MKFEKIVNILYMYNQAVFIYILVKQLLRELNSNSAPKWTTFCEYSHIFQPKSAIICFSFFFLLKWLPVQTKGNIVSVKLQSH